MLYPSTPSWSRLITGYTFKDFAGYNFLKSTFFKLPISANSKILLVSFADGNSFLSAVE